MLKDRITEDTNGFQIRKDPADAGRKAYYVIFALRDAETDISKKQPQPANYWDALHPGMNQTPPRSLIFVWEEKDGKRIEEYQFYIGNAGNKPRIQWSITRAREYGEYAYMIRLKWADNQSEPIHKSHIWLKDRRKGKKFAFLRECIAPAAGTQEDRYVIDVLPGMAEIQDLVIEADEILLQKYQMERGNGR